jgi:DeoR family deoxyribose operon repressor
MSSFERVSFLYDRLVHHRQLHLKEAALLLRVSEMTLRRDIARHANTLTILGGYVVKVNMRSTYASAGAGPDYLGLARKRRAASRAARLVAEGDTIFVDKGETLTCLAEAISADLKITAICYSLSTVRVLRNKPNVRTVVLGGTYNPRSDSFYDSRNSNTLQRMGINHAFMSAAGMDTTHGATCNEADDVAVKQAAIAHAVQSHLVVDSSKHGLVASWRFADRPQFASIITDDGVITQY